jgi:hypothetical protein
VFFLSLFVISCFLAPCAEIFHIVNGGKQLETKKDSQSVDGETEVVQVGGDPAPKKAGACCG